MQPSCPGSSSASYTIHTPICHDRVRETILFHPYDMAEVSESSDLYFLDYVSSYVEVSLDVLVKLFLRGKNADSKHTNVFAF